MTFEEWWMQLHPAEIDELKPVFEDCWKQALLDAAEEFDKRAGCRNIAGGCSTLAAIELRRMAEELK
jgi:hypothetical protein